MNRDIPSEAPNHLSRLNEDSDTKQGLTTQDEEIESQEAWTMEMPSIDGDISTTNSSEQQRIEDKNKQFLYARAMHASHMIQHHMQGISERQRVIDEYRAMMDAGREMIPLDSDLHRSDPVIIQHIMQMIDTDIFWYGETFRQVVTELRKKALYETTMLPGEKLDENEHRESAMMCWESLDESEPTSKKRKTLCQEEATNDPSDKIDDDPHTQRTANKGVGSIIPVNDLQLGTDDDASTLATQETLAKNLVYVTNIPDGKLAHTDIARDSSKNSSEKDGKPSSLLEKPDQLIRKDTLNAYGTSKTNDKREKGKERTTNTWRTRKIIHTEFESDDDVAEPQKNAETTKKEGKVRVTTKTIHYYEFSSDEEDEAHADPKKNEKPHADHEKSTKKGENDQALVSNEMTPSTIGNDIFIGDSAATSHMTNNKTGVYDLKPIRGSVMIGNGESISCTHKGKLDVICKHKDGSTAKHTWEVKIVPQLNHDLFSFTKAMKEGWQMHGRWKEGGLMIELSQTSKNSIKFDRMIPSGSSWLMGLKTQRLVGQAHAVIEPGKSIPILKFHHITGHTGEHLLRPTAEYMGIKLTGKLEPCKMCAQAKITQANVPKKKEKQVPSRPGYRLFIDISSFKHESMGGKRHWLIVVDEFSDCSLSFFLKRKNDQIELFPDWIKELKAKYGIDIKYIRLDNSGENKGLKDECEFHMNKERTKGWLGQPSIIKSLEQKFGEKAMKTRSSLTPRTPRFIARRLENEEDKVNAQDHETYRSGVGTLLYLTKHSRPDISNPVRELSKTMDAPAPAHLKEMYKLIRFVLETQDHGLKFKLMKSIRKWVLKALSDSDFASDKETRISVFGYVIYFCGIPIAWRSKGMKSVVLSTTEAEYMALSEVVKELKFVVQLLQTMNITVELPITVYVDNVGAIWLSNNRNT